MPPPEQGGNGGESAEGSPLHFYEWLGVSNNPDQRQWAGTGEGGVRNLGPRTPIPNQLIGVSADELRKSKGNGGEGLGEEFSPNPLPRFLLPSASGADGGVGEQVSPNGKPLP